MSTQANAAELRNDVQPALMSLLTDLGVDHVSHSGRTLLAHLLGTSRILNDWGCRPALCTAGLFHSIYGTEMFRVASKSLADRTSLQETISVEAENLAYLYGTISRQGLYDAVQTSCDPVIRDFRTGRTVAITPEEFSDLFTLDLANTLEHSSRIYLRPQFMEMYRRGSGSLPAAAVAALDQWAETTRNQPALRRELMRTRFYAVWFATRVLQGLKKLASSVQRS